MTDHERTIILERWLPVYERSDRSADLRDGRALAELVRRMRDEPSASLTVESGQDWLAVCGSAGLLAVGLWLEPDQGFDLVGDPAAAGVVEVVLGGQAAPYPRRYMVTDEAAVAAALEFARGGSVDVGRGWDAQGDPASAWSVEGIVGP